MKKSQLIMPMKILAVIVVAATNCKECNKENREPTDEQVIQELQHLETQTRRPIKPQPKVTEDELRKLGAWQDGYTLSEQVCVAWRHGFVDVDCPYGEISDIINVADKDGTIKGRIEITDVWIQQAQEISQRDAMKEGAPPSHLSIDIVSREHGFPDFSRSWFAQVWMDIYGIDSWMNNEWVWVIEFKNVS